MELKTIRKVLIANRSEMARRILRTLKRMEISSVVVYNESEKDLLYVHEADEAVSLGTGPLSSTFLNGEKLLDIACASGCDAVHPGYGFLAENSDFARRCVERGLLFIGPSDENIRLMGDKTAAREVAFRIGIPIIPGVHGSPEQIMDSMDDTLFPCLVKPALGGGGKAMRVAGNRSELLEAVEHTARESLAYFGNNQVFVEKQMHGCRHIEIQVLADQYGHAAHLFERECSLQRRYQKVLEEAPAVSLTSAIREKLYHDALQLVRAIGYRNVGTVEFLVDSNGNHFFLEMNTRIQVEHPVTEMVTGIDLVQEQIRLAAGHPLSSDLKRASLKGHAMEVRLYAEDPQRDFRPSVATITQLSFPLHSVRVEYDLQPGIEVGAAFDPLLAKVIVHGSNREETLMRMREALEKISIQGLKHNQVFLWNVLHSRAFLDNRINTSFIDQNLKELTVPLTPTLEEKLHLGLVALYLHWNRQTLSLPPAIRQLGAWKLQRNLTFWLNGEEQSVEIDHVDGRTLSVYHANKIYNMEVTMHGRGKLMVCMQGIWRQLDYSWGEEDGIEIGQGINRMQFTTRRPLTKRSQLNQTQTESIFSDILQAPISGKLVKVYVTTGQKVHQGDRMLVIESMKMENEVRIPFNAVVQDVLYVEGGLVREGQPLLRLAQVADEQG